MMYGAATFLHTIPTHGHMQDNKMIAIMGKRTITKIKGIT